jgi:hypothetical protein
MFQKHCSICAHSNSYRRFAVSYTALRSSLADGHDNNDNFLIVNTMDQPISELPQFHLVVIAHAMERGTWNARMLKALTQLLTNC